MLLITKTRIASFPLWVSGHRLNKINMFLLRSAGKANRRSLSPMVIHASLLQKYGWERRKWTCSTRNESFLIRTLNNLSIYLPPQLVRPKWMRTSATSALTSVCTFEVIKFIPAYLFILAKDPAGKASRDRDPSNRNCPYSSKTSHDWRRTVISLTSTTHPHVPLSHISLRKPGSIFNILETVFETLVCCLPSSGLTEVNPFVFPPLSSLPMDFVRSKWPDCLGPLEPHALVPLSPSYMSTYTVVSSDL